MPDKSADIAHFQKTGLVKFEIQGMLHIWSDFLTDRVWYEERGNPIIISLSPEHAQFD